MKREDFDKARDLQRDISNAEYESKGCEKIAKSIVERELKQRQPIIIVIGGRYTLKISPTEALALVQREQRRFAEEAEILKRRFDEI